MKQKKSFIQKFDEKTKKVVQKFQVEKEIKEFNYIKPKKFKKTKMSDQLILLLCSTILASIIIMPISMIIIKKIFEPNITSVQIIIIATIMVVLVFLFLIIKSIEIIKNFKSKKNNTK